MAASGGGGGIWPRLAAGAGRWPLVLVAGGGLVVLAADALMPQLRIWSHLMAAAGLMVWWWWPLI